MEYISDEHLASIFAQLVDPNISVSDIRQSKPDFVQKIYFHFIRDFGANLEQINQSSLDACKSIQQHPEMLQSSMRIMALAKVIRMFLSNIYDGDTFEFSDLVNPNPKKTKRFFRAIVEFYYKTADYHEKVASIEEEIENKEVGHLEMLTKIQKAKEKLHRLKLASAENQICEEQELEQIMEMKPQLKKTQETKIGLKSKLESLKMESSTLMKHIKDVELKIFEVDEKIDKLGSRVVEASERQEIEEREAKLGSLRNEVKEKSECVVKLKTASQVYSTAQDLLNDQLLEVLQEVQEEDAKKKEQLTKLSRLHRLKASLLEEVEGKTMKAQQLMVQSASQDEKKAQIMRAFSLKKESLLEEIGQSKLLLEEINRNIMEDNVLYQEKEAIFLKKKHDIQQLEEKEVDVNNYIVINYRSVVDARENHHQRLRKKMCELQQTVGELKL